MTVDEMDLELEQSALSGPTSESEVADLENRIGARLPDSYREFLLKFNGGIPLKRRLRYFNPVDDEDEETEVECFYGLHRQHVPDKFSSRLHVSMDYALQRYVAPNLPDERVLPIGQDAGSNIIVMALGDEKAGSIMLYDSTYQELFPLADSFSQFCALLEELEDDD